jgi:hypothetical protein
VVPGYFRSAVASRRSRNTLLGAPKFGRVETSLPIEKPKTHASGARPEKRKARRFPVAVPVEVRWRGPDGENTKEHAQAKQVNAHGALLQMKTYPDAGSRVELINFLSAQAAQARVLGLRHTREGAVLGLAVELVVPSETFWGVNFQLKKTNAELFQLEQALRSSGVDLRVLGEYRDAVECLRVIAGAVQELQERQLQGLETDEVLRALAVERVRRAAYLSNELAIDLDACQVNGETKGLDELYRAVQHLHQRLMFLFGHRESWPQLSARTLEL